MKALAIALTSAALFIAGCNVDVKEHKKGEAEDVSIKSPFGGLKVRTDEVNPADTGMTVFPGSTLKPRSEHDENKAHVDIDTPWFGVKVVAITYLTDAPSEKVWSYYRDELSKKWGKPLECRAGSPDMDKKKSGKDDLTCHEKESHNVGLNINSDNSDMQLKVGTEDRQHVVAMKTENGKTQYSLVYVTVRGEKDTI